ncbi:MAG: hypothetical protein HYY17_02850 [Planctomycetes bacterium]|nr:hypothetical protein [Planctomycetota bacterium]
MLRWIASLAVLILAGCGGGGGTGDESPSSGGTTLTSDFTPPTGKVAGPADHGPWSNRLMVATSPDGLNFTRTYEVISDQADVPDLVIDSQGWLRLYYLGWTVGTENNKVVVAISTDGGGTWAYKRVNLSGFTGMSSPVDPDVQLLSSGTFRMFVTSDPNDGAGPRTYLAEGTDGINFSKVGVAFSVPGKAVLDPTTLQTGAGWHLFAGGSVSAPGANWHATSADGKNFAYVGEQSFTYVGTPCAVSNGLAVPGGYRFYGFTQAASSIVSFFSADGETWTSEPGTRLTLDTASGLEAHGVKDAAVIRLANGTYLMVYVTEIP